MKIWYWFSILFVAFLVGCSESSFELSAQSRLPSWFEIPEGMTRADLRVRVDYYVRADQREAIFTLFDNNNNKIHSVIGKQKGLRPIETSETKDGRPIYEIITVNGISEIIEHREKNNVIHIFDGELE